MLRPSGKVALEIISARSFAEWTMDALLLPSTILSPISLQNSWLPEPPMASLQQKELIHDQHVKSGLLIVAVGLSNNSVILWHAGEFANKEHAAESMHAGDLHIAPCMHAAAGGVRVRCLESLLLYSMALLKTDQVGCMHA